MNALDRGSPFGGTPVGSHSRCAPLFSILKREAAELGRSGLHARQDGEVRPDCGSGSSNLHYDTPLHVFALVLILVLSTLACCFPIVARRFPSFPVPHRFLFLSRHFGTGVLIATAFVHLLPTAFISLTDPCLPPFWNKGYPPMAGFIALMSVLAVVGIEMFFATRGAGHVHSSDYGMIDQEAHKSTADFLGSNGHTKELLREPRALRHFRHESFGSANLPDAVLYDAPTGNGDQENMAGPRKSSSDEGSNAELDTSDDDAADAPEAAHQRRGRGSGEIQSRLLEDGDESLPIPKSHADGVDSKTPLSLQSEEQKLLLQCLLLEAGILFHSIFIGMALSVATGTSFMVLLVAISFHQTFEGLALGSRIAAITSFGPKSAKPWLMALAYGTTTPIGQAIGLGVHNLYDPEGEMGLIMVGVFNSMSSGLLLFAGLVELLAADFLSDESYKTLCGRKRLEACAAVVAGALLMALVGAWA